MFAPWRPLLLAAMSLALATTSCLQVCYLAQAAAGQDDISYRARPIEEVLKDRSVDPETRSMLSLIEDVKRFGETQGIKPTNSYREYVELDRPVVVWVVSASHPLRFEPVTWWFPIVGSVPYLGYFAERDAQRFAAELREEGWDVDERGARAYSTLGWFDDPILSTMIRPRHSAVGDMVNVVIHESTHATYYVQSQSSFNESLADFVADQLTERYLTERLSLDRWELYEYREAAVQREEREKRFHKAYVDLDRLYRGKLSDADKLARKAVILRELEQDVDFWRPINNATLIGSRTYHGGNDVFGEVFAHCGRDWERFWTLMKTIDEDSFAEPQQADINPLLRRLMKKPCPR
jgi:predicted aminopeptidase